MEGPRIGVLAVFGIDAFEGVFLGQKVLHKIVELKKYFIAFCNWCLQPVLGVK